MAEGGTLHIEARNIWWRGAPEHPQTTPGAYVVVTVTDTGTGMTAAVRARSCEPFFTTRAQAGHSGLGLSTAQGLGKGHGGWLKTTSQPGSGTTVEVYLPAIANTLLAENATCGLRSAPEPSRAHRPEYLSSQRWCRGLWSRTGCLAARGDQQT
ncbi:MAG: ATP-binding protein [Nodosilinea sp.]